MIATFRAARRLAGDLYHGRALRHLPVVMPTLREVHIGVTLVASRGWSVDVSGDHVPVSLRPLMLGVRLDDIPAHVVANGWVRLELRDHLANGALLGTISLAPAGSVRLTGGILQLFSVRGCTNNCAPRLSRWKRYAMSWRHARRERDSGRFWMTARDLRCLNVYYIVPRPVFLVSVAHGDQNNVFPMDLVGPVSSGEYLLALRATSPSIETIEQSRRIVMSAAPAAQLKAVYDLGRHHRERNIDINSLALATIPSPLYQLPMATGAPVFRELRVRGLHHVGSHVLFVTDIEHEATQAAAPNESQMAHVSGMYAEWLAAHGRALRALASS